MPVHPIPVATRDPRSPRAVVAIQPADLLRSIYLVGKTGTGKSTFLENLLIRSVDAGFGAALIDPHGDLFWRILENLPPRHWNRVAILRPADGDRTVGVNLLGAVAWGSRTLVASGVIEIFRTLWGPTLFGPRSEHVLRHAVLAILDTPAATLLGLLRFLVDADYRTRALARVTDPVVRVFWAKEYPALGKQFAAEVSAPVLNKLGALASPVVRRIVGQAAPRLDLRQVMDNRRIMIVDLSGIGRDAAQFIGAIIVTGLDLAAHARATARSAERPQFLLVADEFHSYMTRSFLTLLAEGRKFGICAALAHQHAAQLDAETRAAILGNAGTLGAFSLSADDAKSMAPEFAPELSVEDLVRLRRHHFALRLLRNGEPQRPMVVRTLSPVPASGDVPDTLLRISAERYGRPVDVVDREIREALGVSPTAMTDQRAA
jgi:Type IV secretion-system coupling protein DNA-binding domain